MADACHPEDTVFFVAEGDFRFYREDALAEATVMDQLCTVNRIGRVTELLQPTAGQGVWSWLGDPNVPVGEPVAPAGPASAGEPVAPAGSGASSARASSAAEPKYEPARDVFAYTSPTKPSAAEFKDVSPELIDLLCYMTAAEKVGRGNLCWFGWNANPNGGPAKRSQSIANGSQLIAITTKGARWLKDKLEVCPARFRLGAGRYRGLRSPSPGRVRGE